jgi:hypothetical protein
VDVFNKQLEPPKYSRMVSVAHERHQERRPSQGVDLRAGSPA